MSQDNIAPVRVKFSKIFVGFSGKFTEWMAYEALEGAILGLFDCFSPEEIYQAITEDISIWRNPWHNFEEFRYQLRLIGHDPRFTKYEHLFTTENIIEWLSDKEARPILASLIVNTPGGYEWLEKQVSEFKQELTAPLEEEIVVRGTITTE
jgi:hypothetical protein